MREAKFRGKAVLPAEKLDLLEIPHKDGWVYGALIYNNGAPYIISHNVVESSEEFFNPEWWYPVEPASVGQYTDQNMDKIEIYEGDIIKGTYLEFNSKKEGVFVVEWDKSGYWTYRGPKDFRGGYLTDLKNIKVIGNTYENRNLL